MAHEFETGMFVKQEAWHKLGVVLEENPTTDEAFLCSGLDWEVKKERLSFHAEGQRRATFTDMNALVRQSDTKVLGYCKDQYEIYQNSQAFDWCRPLVESELWSWETAGSLKGGEVCWALLKQGDVEVVPDDVMKQYLLVSWGHNGKTSNMIQPTSIRVVCNNTLQASLSQGNVTKIRHNSAIIPNMESVQKLYDNSQKVFEKQNEDFKRMVDKNLTDSEIEQFVDKLYPISEEAEGRQLTLMTNTNEFVKNLAFGGASGSKKLGIVNTVYGVFQAISEANEHFLGGNRVKDRGMSVLFGSAFRKNKEAYNLALKIAS